MDWHLEQVGLITPMRGAACLESIILVSEKIGRLVLRGGSNKGDLHESAHLPKDIPPNDEYFAQRESDERHH